MNPTQYLAFIPLLFYSIALSELLGQWKRFFDRTALYWPYILTAIIFTEIVIYNVFNYLEVIGDLGDVGYFRCWVFLLQPILFLVTVKALTPDQNIVDIPAFFRKRIPLVFDLMAVFLACHFLPGFSGGSALDLPRIIAILFCLAIAVTRSIPIIYILTVIWLITLILRS